MPPCRGRCAVALVAVLLAAGNGLAQLPVPDIRSELLGSPTATTSPTAPPDPSIAPPYASPNPAQIDTGNAPVTGWDDGFYIRSQDRRFSLRVTGQIQADYRWYANPDDRNDIGGFVVRRARFGLEAVLFKYYEFRFLPDFGQGQTVLQDAFLNVHYWDTAQFTAGKFKQPFSYEQLIQDRFTPFMERSLIDQLVPARDIGVMLHGQNLLGNRLDYGLAVSNGERNGDVDTNASKDVNARVAVRPFEAWNANPLRGLQIGISGGWGVQNEPVNPATLRTPAGVTFFQFRDGVLADGVRSRFSPEVAYFIGGFGASAQYFHMEQKLRPAPDAAVVRVPYDGFYVQATYLLTGEERTGYSQQIAPRRPFDLTHACYDIGAWEVVGRVSRIRAGDVVFVTGAEQLADPAAFSNGATEMTLGLNWYLNRWARVQFNWEHAWFDRRVLLGPRPRGLLSGQDTLMTRLQFVF